MYIKTRRVQQKLEELFGVAFALYTGDIRSWSVRKHFEK